MALLSAELQAKAFQTGLNLLVPGKAVILQQPGGYVVRPDAKQTVAIRDFLDRKVNRAPTGKKGTPGGEPSVKLDLSEAYMPVVIKKVAPFAIGLVALGYLIGKAT